MFVFVHVLILFLYTKLWAFEEMMTKKFNVSSGVDETGWNIISGRNIIWSLNDIKRDFIYICCAI